MTKRVPFLPLFDPPDQPDSAGPRIDPADRRGAATPQPPDADARAQALDSRRSFIVEAPAGSGKTGLLIQRLLKLLADESVTAPEQVLAVTFTKKATAEMRDRVLAHLVEAAHPPAQPAVLTEVAAEALPWPAPASHDFQAETRALAVAVLERDRRLEWALLDHPHRLNIRTIDSVCAEIARTLPVLSGSGGRLAPVADAEPLHREAARRTLLLLGGGDADIDDALRDLLLHRDGNLANCEELLAEMLKLRDQWGDLVPLGGAQLDEAWLDANVLARLEAALDRAICATLSEVTRSFPADVLAELSEIAAEMAHADGYKRDVSPIALCKNRSQPPEAVAGDLDHWRSLIHLLVRPSKPRDWRKSVSRNVVGFEIERHHEAQLQNILARLSDVPGLSDLLVQADSLPPARYPEDQWAVAKSLFRVLSRALVELQFVFAERNQCDFAEFGLLARHALEQDNGPDDLAAALGARLQHLLVDEIQDTSTSQYRLIELLTASWDGHSQTVFLVGDPRQSIYLFRQARVERFVDAMLRQRLGELRLTRLRLTANFRSQRDLVEQFNSDFALVFSPQSGGLDANALPHTDAHATLPASPHAAGVVWHANPVAAAQTAEGAVASLTPAQVHQQQARRDAREIRRIVRQWLAKPLPTGRTEPWRLAVLVRSRTHLIEIVAALNQEAPAIPVRAVEIDLLSERQEVLDLTALTRALLHPADRVAALAVLRAPWCGLSLADLHTLTGADDPDLKPLSVARLIAERGHLLAEESRRRVARVRDVLQSAAEQRARRTVAQLVERAWRSLGGDAWLTPAQLNNVGRFLQLIDALEAESGAGRIDPALLNARLEELYAESEPVPRDTAFVELLTIHKAKGLEWDVVFVPALERGPAPERTRLLSWSEIDSADEEAAHMMLAPIRGSGEESTALNLWVNRIYRAREAAERKRLFYVACTRARQELHLFAAPDISVRGNINPRWNSLLKAAWPAAELHFSGSHAGASEPPIRSRLAPGAAEKAATRLSGPTSPADGPGLDLAAAAGVRPKATLQRLPPGFDPTARFSAARARRLACAEPESADRGHGQFARPEGSVAARAFGNAVHAFLQILAARIASGGSAAALLDEIPRWTPRITAVLRAEGLPPSTVERLKRETRMALESTLRDPDGLWLLAPHPEAASELGRTAWLDTAEGTSGPASVRIDRVFRGGPEPRQPGEDVLWIVDYKTASHGAEGLEGFLDSQRAVYTAQLETYARILTQAARDAAALGREIRVALYYPTIPRLIWWKPVTSTTGSLQSATRA